MKVFRRPNPMMVMTILLCLVQMYSAAQEKAKVQFGKLGPEDFVLPATAIIDSNANAVILADIGAVKFMGGDKGGLNYVYRRHTRIKILNKKALKLATVNISLYIGKDGDAEKADNILASAYNLENGKIVETKLDKKDIFEEKENKNHTAKKFTMAAVREGSIIEYTYTINSGYIFSLPTWEFQSLDYPTLWSEYEVAIPQTYFYVFVKQGVHSYLIDKGSESRESYKLKENKENLPLGVENRDLIISANTIKHRWAMKDVPAFHVENYLTTPWNYIDKIDFQLEKTYNGEDVKDVMNTWKQATGELLDKENFGRPLKEDNEFLDDLVNKMNIDLTSALQEVRSIYYYLTGHFTCTNHYDPYIKTDLRDVVKKNSGTVGDLNLLLIAILRKKGFLADPVLLSTREHGFNLIKYPVLEKLNYVIARVTVNGKAWYLDVAHPKLGFGQLAGNCYNGHARIISEKDSGAVYFEPDSLKEKKSTMVFLSNGPKGIEGSYQSLMGMQESYNIREKLSDIGMKAWFKNIQTTYGDEVDISNTGIDSVDKPEDPLNIHYDFTLRPGSETSILYFNPIIGEAYHENPFKAAERKYPVEMPYSMDNIYVMNMEIPAGYVIDEMPKSAKVAFNGDQGSFEYLIAKQDNMIQLRCRIRLNHASFPPEDYETLRDFFGFIVKKENEQIVLKKQ